MGRDKISSLLCNVRKERKDGKTRGRNGGRAHTAEESAALEKKEAALILKQKTLAAARRQKTIEPSNTHTTSETNLNMEHASSEASSTKDHITHALSVLSNKNVQDLMMEDDYKKIEKGDTAAYRKHHAKYDASSMRQCRLS